MKKFKFTKSKSPKDNESNKKLIDKLLKQSEEKYQLSDEEIKQSVKDVYFEHKRIIQTGKYVFYYTIKVDNIFQFNCDNVEIDFDVNDEFNIDKMFNTQKQCVGFSFWTNSKEYNTFIESFDI